MLLKLYYNSHLGFKYLHQFQYLFRTTLFNEQLSSGHSPRQDIIKTTQGDKLVTVRRIPESTTAQDLYPASGEQRANAVITGGPGVL